MNKFKNEKSVLLLCLGLLLPSLSATLFANENTFDGNQIMQENIVNIPFTKWDVTPGWRTMISKDLKASKDFKLKVNTNSIKLTIPEVDTESVCTIYPSGTKNILAETEYLLAVKLFCENSGEFSMNYIQNRQPWKISWSQSFKVVPGQNIIHTYITLDEVTGSHDLRFYFGKLRGDVTFYAPTLIPAALLPAKGDKQAAEEFIDAMYKEQADPVSMKLTFNSHTNYAVFSPQEKVSLTLSVQGYRKDDDELVWDVYDFDRKVLLSKKIAVPAGESIWKTLISLPDFGPGYFEFCAKLKKSKVTFSKKETSLPDGIRSYAVLPDITPLKLKYSDDSHFGAQGTAHVDPTGDSFAPLYELVGVRWLHAHVKAPWITMPAWVEKREPNTYKPNLDKKKLAHDYRFYRKNNLCGVFDLHSIPPWLMDCPEGVKPPAPEKIVPTHNCQTYPPKDWDYYGDLLGRIAQEKKAIRETSLTAQRRSYYKINWEIDWYWKGSDQELIKLYKTASNAIKQVDPDSYLLGINCGILKNSNDYLGRLFPMGLGKYIDGVITHSYFLAPTGENGSSPEEGGVVEDARKLVELTRKYLPVDAPIINAEGSSRIGGYNISVDHWVLKQQAAWFLRTHLICLGEGFSSTWFFLLADPSKYGGNYGIFYSRDLSHAWGPEKVSPKPMFSAVATATRLLEGTKSLGALEFIDQNVLGYGFKRANDYIITLWSTDEKKRTVSVPVGNDEVIVYSPMGKAMKVRAKAGMVRVKVTGNPIYIMGVAKESLPLQNRLNMPAITGALANQVISLSSTIEPTDNYTYTFIRGSQVLSAGKGANPTVPEDATSNTWLLQAYDGTKLVASQLVNVLSPIKFELIDGKKFTNEKYNFSLTNVTSKSLIGKLSLCYDNSTYPLGEVSLEPHQSLTKSIIVPRLKVDSNKPTLCSLEFKDSNGKSFYSEEINYSMSQANEISRDLKIDGDLTDWKGIEFEEVFGEDALIINARLTSLSGKDDLSFTYAFAYNDQKLYFAVRVRDQDHVQVTKSNMWRQDSIQLALATGENWSSWRKILIGLNSIDDVIRCSGNMGVNNKYEDLFRIEAVDCVVKRNSNETIYEFAIDWNKLDPNLDGLPEDKRIAYGILVNDHDFELGSQDKLDKKLGKTSAKALTELMEAQRKMTSRRKGMSAYKGMFWQRDPNKLNILLLKDKIE